MTDATRCLLETFNSVKDTGELLIQEKLINREKVQLKKEPISDDEENWADNSTPPHVYNL